MSEWISVKNRLPEEFGYYIVAQKGIGACIRGYDDGEQRWSNDCNTDVTRMVTHWMNAPEPPNDDDAGEWVSIADRLPEESGYYLTVDKNSDIYILKYTEKLWWDDDYCINVTNMVAYWMPLPESQEHGDVNLDYKYPIVFGNTPEGKTDKGVVGAVVSGMAHVFIVRLREIQDVGYRFESKDVNNVMTELRFLRKDSMRTFIGALQEILDRWEDGDDS